MKKISGFDIGMIIAFVVVALLGGGAWWYLSGQLQAARDEATTASSDFNKFSGKGFYPTQANIQALESDIQLMSGQLDPVIKTVLDSPDSKLGSIQKEDTVAWKHRLDDEVRQLNAAAKLHAIAVPPNFYYGFSRYLNQNPSEEQTQVLSKQLLGVEQIATIFINAPVKGIRSIRRSYEEDPPVPGNPGGRSNVSSDPDLLGGNSISAPGDVYTAYPFEVEFDATPDGLRKIVDDLMKSPDIFVIRTLTIQNSKLDSPQLGDLAKIAGTQDHSMLDSPGETAANKPNVAPQFLFGGETLQVKARIDLIEWHASADLASADAKGKK